MERSDARPPRPDPLPAPAWAHAHGFLGLTEAEPADAVDSADRALIVERLYRYCWCYDERRLDLLQACFTPDGVWEGNVMGEIPIGPFTGAEAVGAWLSEFWPYQRDQRRHMILNAVVTDQHDDVASVVAYVLLMSAKDAAVRMETMGFYRLSLRKIEGLWRISHLFGGFDAPFWPGQLAELSPRARARHGIRVEADVPEPPR